MAKSLNSVTIMGNLTRDPELKQVNSSSVVNFSLALNRVYTVDGERREATDFIEVEGWGKTAELTAQYMSKGRRCLVQGRLQNQVWDKDGVKKSKMIVLAEDVTFLDNPTT